MAVSAEERAASRSAELAMRSVGVTRPFCTLNETPLESAASAARHSSLMAAAGSTGKERLGAALLVFFCGRDEPG